MRLIPDDALRTESGGRVLLGGHPFRVMRLSATGAEQVRSWFRGESLPSRDAELDLAARLIEAGLAHPEPDPLPARCHVVIPFRGDPDELDATITGLRSCPVDSIVVVDDGNDPPLRSIPGVQILRHERPKGPAAARNTGWRSLQHDETAHDASIVAFVDAGVTVPSVDGSAASWLERLAGHLRDPAVAAVAPRIASTPGTSAIHRYESRCSPLDLGITPGVVGPGRLVPYVPTACLLVRSADLDAIDGFDEALRFGEDVDLVWRLVATGRTVRYEPSVVLLHEPRSSLRAFAHQRFRYASAAASLQRRHGSDVAPWRSSVVGAAGVVLLSAGRPLTGLLIGLAPLRALSAKLDTTATPDATAVRLLAQGHLWAVRSFAESVGRTWAPFALVAMILTPRRRLSAGWMIAGWLRRTATTRSVPLLALGIVDDVAYGVGALTGAIRAGSPRALLPKITRWG